MIVASLSILVGGVCGLLWGLVCCAIVDEFSDGDLSCRGRRMLHLGFVGAGLAIGIAYGAFFAFVL